MFHRAGVGLAVALTLILQTPSLAVQTGANPNGDTGDTTGSVSAGTQTQTPEPTAIATPEPSPTAQQPSPEESAPAPTQDASPGPNSSQGAPTAATTTQSGKADTGRSQRTTSGVFPVGATMGQALTTVGGLGEATGPETVVGEGSYQQFSDGALFLTPTRGPVVVRGQMLTSYLSLGGPSSPLGYPTAAELPLAGKGSTQTFDAGVGYRSESTGAHFVRGSIGQEFQKSGGVGSRLGFPVGEEVADAKSGVHQVFEGGRYYWRPGIAAQPMVGGMLNNYLSKGGPSSSMGYPLTGERSTVRNGKYQNFDGAVGYWTSATGAHFVRDGFLGRYKKESYERGLHGYPTTDEYKDRGVTRQDFEHGSYWWGAMPSGTYSFNVAWAGQPNNYFCGPTSGYMILRHLKANTSAQGTGLSINALASASYMNTVGYGYTSFNDRKFSSGMNRWLGLNVYRTIHTPSIATVRDSVKNSFSTGYPIAVDEQERRGGPHFNGHPNSTFSHIMVVSAYNTKNDAVQIVDPGAGVLWGGSRAFWYPSLATFTTNFLQREVERDGRQHIGIHTS